jgi:hypothetical protein
MNGLLSAHEDLTPTQRDAMFALLSTHFRGVTRERFEADLAEKNWVVLLEDDAGNLAGFSTFLHYRATLASAGGETVGVIYSGDTIMDPRAWSSSVLSRTWIDSVWRVHRAPGSEEAGRLLWLFITSGFRTYRFLPVFWREFYPCHVRATPPEVASVMRELARERFGEQYEPAPTSGGVVRFAHPQVLSESLRGIPEAKLADPHVAFFAAANPGHERGDELVCLTELSEANLTPAGWRMVLAGRKPVETR